MGPDDQTSGYQGDAALRALLDRHGVTLSLDAIRALLAGVNAASVDRSDAGWLDLIAPGASPALAAQLAALRAQQEAAPAAPAVKPLEALRAELARQGLGGFIVPRADEHQGEYVPACAQRLHWLTGFTGSIIRGRVINEAEKGMQAALRVTKTQMEH